ncbi:MAG: hypothetical protein COB49_03105 [Alphaproteobacteria bacterium]|nr:MAG: hypothetical protein COB49_03105 [Alphaproteobacteria bacterium]
MKFNLRLLDSIQAEIDSLSKSERRIAQLLLSNPSLFTSESLGTVADTVGLSQPTIIRFCRNVGFDGFKDLKISLAKEIAVDKAFREVPVNDPREGATGSFLDPLRQGITDIINQSVAALDIQSLEESVKLIKGCQKLYIYGLGGSSSAMALEAQNRFFRLGVSCEHHSDCYVQRMTAAITTDKDAVLIISSTGEPRPLIDCLEIARQRGCRTIAMAPSASAVGELADYCLDIPLGEVNVPYYHPSPIRYAQMFLIDCLAHRVAIQLGDRAKNTLKKIRSTVTSLHDVVESQPIGD